MCTLIHVMKESSENCGSMCIYARLFYLFSLLRVCVCFVSFDTFDFGRVLGRVGLLALLVHSYWSSKDWFYKVQKLLLFTLTFDAFYCQTHFRLLVFLLLLRYPIKN